MIWNYRTMRHSDESLAIHEAFYDEDKETPHSCTVDPVGVVGEDLADLTATLGMMGRALMRPVLDYEIIMASQSLKPSIVEREQADAQRAYYTWVKGCGYEGSESKRWELITEREKEAWVAVVRSAREIR